MEAGLREVCRSVRIGKILIQRVCFLSIDEKIILLKTLRMRKLRKQNCSMQRSTINMCSSQFSLSDESHAIYSFLLTSPTATSFFWIPCLVRTQHYFSAESFTRQLATGGSAIKAVEVILSHGVPENRIIFINLVGDSFLFMHKYPFVRIS